MPGKGKPFSRNDPRRNKGGRPPIDPDVKAALAAACPRAVERLVELVESDDERIALAAAQAVVERLLGKAVQPIDPLSSMTDEEVLAEAKRIMAAQ